MSLFDLTLYPLLRTSGKISAAMPGLYYARPPSRCTRSRQKDRLIIYLALQGTLPYPEEAQKNLLQRLGEIYFQTSGSVTAALRESIHELNAVLSALNINAVQQGHHINGRAVLAAARGDDLYLLISGPCEIISLGQNGVQVIAEDVRAGKGLGAGPNAPFFLQKISLESPQKIIFGGFTPQEWRSYFAHEQADTPAPILRETLWQLTSGDVHALMLDIAAGTGWIGLETESASRPAAAGTRQVSAAEDAAQLEASPTPSGKKIAPSKAHWLNRPAAKKKKTVMARPRLSETQKREAAQQALKVLQGFQRKKEQTGQTVKHFLPRLLPTESALPFSAPTWLLVLIAVLVPLLVAAITGITYTRHGLQHEARVFYQQAAALAGQARAETNPVLQREGWEQVLYALEQADRLYPLEESVTLRREASDALDKINNITRLNFRHADFTLPAESAISQIAAWQDTLYMLDTQAQKVWRAVRTANGYRLDKGFQCAVSAISGEGQTAQADDLTDIAPLPAGHSSGAEVLAVTAQGLLLYCSADNAPQAMQLPRSQHGFQRADAIAWVHGYLYVLDSASRSVWIYPQNEEGHFVEQPYYFFDEQIPHVENAMDMVIYDKDLFLLNKDSTITTCHYNAAEPIYNYCQDPVTLHDNRPGYSDTPHIPDTQFLHMILSPPPSQTLFLLDGLNQSIYRITPSNHSLQNVFRPAQGSIPPDAVFQAMSINQERTLFVSLGNAIYYADHIP